LFKKVAEDGLELAEEGGSELRVLLEESSDNQVARQSMVAVLPVLWGCIFELHKYGSLC
jgi:hypothetical protein